MTARRRMTAVLALSSLLGACNTLLGNDARTPTKREGSAVEPSQGDSDHEDASTGAQSDTKPDASSPEGGTSSVAPDAGKPVDSVDAATEAGMTAGSGAPEAGKSSTAVDAGSCTLSESEEMREDCGLCKNGKRMRARVRKRKADCTWGEWGAWGACEGASEECKPGEQQSEMAACGNCNTGMKSHTRTCSPDTCSWGEYAAYGECAGASTECAAGEVQMDAVPCGPCNSGSAARTRACSPATCTWGDYSVGMCTGITAACSPGETTACPSGTCKNSAGNNTCPRCGQRVCQANCSWGNCESKGSCLDDHWRCCGSGGWQWCDPSTCNYYACDSCMGDADCARSCQ